MNEPLVVSALESETFKAAHALRHPAAHAGVAWAGHLGAFMGGG